MVMTTTTTTTAMKRIEPSPPFHVAAAYSSNSPSVAAERAQARVALPPAPPWRQRPFTQSQAELLSSIMSICMYYTRLEPACVGRAKTTWTRIPPAAWQAWSSEWLTSVPLSTFHYLSMYHEHARARLGLCPLPKLDADKQSHTIHFYSHGSSWPSLTAQHTACLRPTSAPAQLDRMLRVLDRYT